MLGRVGSPGRRRVGGATRESREIAPRQRGAQIRENVMPLGTHRSRGTLTLGIAVLAALLAFALSGGGTVHAQGSPPPGPVVYSGTVTVGGSAAPDGLSIVARIQSPSTAVVADYQSQPRVTSGGNYSLLSVGPPSVFFNNRIISFHIIPVENTATAHLDPEGLTASEVATFLPGPNVIDGFALTFPAIPPAPEPTPTPRRSRLQRPSPRPRRSRRRPQPRRPSRLRRRSRPRRRCRPPRRSRRQRRRPRPRRPPRQPRRRRRRR